MELPTQFSILNILVLVTLGLMVVFTGGVAYLTIVEWRDRRLQDEEKRNTRKKR